MQAGKHVLCEKPLASSVAEASAMVALAKQKGLANCTLYNVRAYPQVQNMRTHVRSGRIWRYLCRPGHIFAGLAALRHGLELAHRIRAVAHLRRHRDPLVRSGRAHHRAAHHFCVRRSQTFHKTRKKPKHSVETFTGKTLQPSEYDEVPIKTEDFGAMMFAMGEKTKGSLTVSQVSGGRKNRLFIEIFGSKASAAWNSEAPDELWIGHRNAPNEILIKDPVLMRPEARSYTDLPGGHSEGYPDTFKQIFRRFYRRVVDANAPVEYPTFEDGIRQLRVLDAVLGSSQKESMGDRAGLSVCSRSQGSTFAWCR